MEWCVHKCCSLNHSYIYIFLYMCHIILLKIHWKIQGVYKLEINGLGVFRDKGARDKVPQLLRDTVIGALTVITSQARACKRDVMALWRTGSFILFLFRRRENWSSERFLTVLRALWWITFAVQFEYWCLSHYTTMVSGKWVGLHSELTYGGCGGGWKVRKVILRTSISQSVKWN